MQSLMDNKWNFYTINRASTILFMLLLLFAFTTSVKGQNKYKLIKTFPVEGSVLAADELKNAYVVNNENNVLKLDSLGSLSSIYSENEYGTATAIDATNPFEILVFYKDFNTAISLDINMSAKQLYKFSSVGINDVAAVCRSYDNTIWVYDMSEQKLKKVNTNYEVTHESFEVNKLLDGILEPNYMVERDNMLYVTDPQRGIFIFDMNGTYFRSYLFPEVESLQIINSNLVFFKNNELNVFDMKTQREEKIILPEEVKDIQLIQVTRDYLMLLTKSELSLYSVTVEE